MQAPEPTGHLWSLKRPAHPAVLSDQMAWSRHSGPGCRPQYYFWESVILSRNLLLVVLVFVAPGMGVGTSAACLLHAALSPLKEALLTDSCSWLLLGYSEQSASCAFVLPGGVRCCA